MEKNKRSQNRILSLLAAAAILPGLLFAGCRKTQPEDETKLPDPPQMEKMDNQPQTVAEVIKRRSAVGVNLILTDEETGEIATISDPDEVDTFMARLEATTAEPTDENTPLQSPIRIQFRNMLETKTIFSIGNDVMKNADGKTYTLSPGISTEEIRKQYKFVSQKEFMVAEKAKTVSFPEAAGYDGKEIDEIRLSDGNSGAQARLTDPQEIEDFLKLFADVSATKIYESASVLNGFDISAALCKNGETVASFCFGTTSLKIIDGERETLYALNKEINTNIHIRQKYTFTKTADG